MVKLMYLLPIHLKIDFIGPIGTFDTHLLSGAPPRTHVYYTLIKPFGPTVWAFILASLVIVSITLIIINQIYATWTKEHLKESPFQS